MDTQYSQFNLSLNFSQVIDIVSQLSPLEKQRLGEVLWTGQDVNDIFVSEDHKNIVRERIKKYDNTPSSYLSWNDIERKMAVGK